MSYFWGQFVCDFESTLEINVSFVKKEDSWLSNFKNPVKFKRHTDGYWSCEPISGRFVFFTNITRIYCLECYLSGGRHCPPRFWQISRRRRAAAVARRRTTCPPRFRKLLTSYAPVCNLFWKFILPLPSKFSSNNCFPNFHESFKRTNYSFFRRLEFTFLFVFHAGFILIRTKNKLLSSLLTASGHCSLTFSKINTPGCFNWLFQAVTFQ